MDYFVAVNILLLLSKCIAVGVLPFILTVLSAAALARILPRPRRGAQPTVVLPIAFAMVCLILLAGTIVATSTVLAFSEEIDTFALCIAAAIAAAYSPFAGSDATSKYVQIRFAQRDRRFCVNCAYDLSGNVSGRCPECGAVTAAAT